ncbi:MULTISPECIES: hypothetical protein [Brevibacillus]|jgi:hypothetical protein|uniref:Uncharacterized protein n=1 Tax=Brevibacillus parabrevis TaxID=54914 RepID=A0A4Y3PWD3_BREPA|nr:MULTISPECIES: hypothetical protein [Brevibacillus]MBU8710914.1 hypothetical protein [Brevibacillus parabrevis]MDH6351764.1 hypothetical protein [Brevibacillus sp. 1238]MDR5002143.1 hypothetical protein [Brevibacillus parabrevis]MED1724628.1 hypothetical protein [Brevibacillus parabrevis]MED2253583.1 hypothetical protein [Brevibacillus parabrevis]
MKQSSDVNAELQQVSAYPTKQKMNQKDVALFDEQKGCGCTPEAKNAANTEQG